MEDVQEVYRSVLANMSPPDYLVGKGRTRFWHRMCYTGMLTWNLDYYYLIR